MSFDVSVIDPPSAMHIATIMNTSLGKKVTFGTFAYTPDTNPTSPALPRLHPTTMLKTSTCNFTRLSTLYWVGRR